MPPFRTSDVLSKWYPPDFDPSAIERSAKSKDGKSSKLPNVRLMTPFSMKCTHCGEYIPKGRKFNARKEVTDERYLSIQIIRFYIRCTRCSGEITFRTDPKNNDYQCENGAKRNFEVWRDAKDDKYQDETEEQTLDRLEKEHGEKEDQIERDKMAELEDKMLDSKREMKVADALDEIRTRNARIERKEAGGAVAALATAQAQADEEALRAEQEAAADAEAIRQEFREKKRLAQQARVDEEMRRLEEESAKLRAKPFVVKRLPRRSQVLAARQALFDQKRPLDAGDSKGTLDKKRPVDAGDSKGTLDKKRPLDAGDFKGIFDKKPRKE